MNLLQNLRAVVAALELEPHQPSPITTNGPSSDFIRARLAPPGMIGVRVRAAEAWQNLVRGLFDADVRYQRGITFKEFQDETFEAQLGQILRDRAGQDRQCRGQGAAGPDVALVPGEL